MEISKIATLLLLIITVKYNSFHKNQREMQREKFIVIAWSRYSKQETLGYNLIHVYVTAEARNVSKILCLLNSCMYRHFLTASVWYLRQLEFPLSSQIQLQQKEEMLLHANYHFLPRIVSYGSSILL